MDNDRTTAIADLSAALSALEAGGAPAPFLGGHGIQSRLFEFTWCDSALEIDFRLPCDRILEDDESRRAHNVEIGAAIRLALLLLQAPAAAEGGRTTVTADARGVGYSIFGADGSLEDAGDNWASLVRRLEPTCASAGSAATVIRP